jgi:hypothetical protein
MTVVALVFLPGCRGQAPDANVTAAGRSPSSGADPASQELGDRISKLINDASERFWPLEYEYDEDLLGILDRVEARLAGKSAKLDPLPMPKLDEAEQLDHFRETIRRWTGKTGKNLRAEIEPLNAEVAARQPGGKPFHPEFHKKFAAVFDDFIPIEVAEIRERRNRAIHAKADALFKEYRDTAPDMVRQSEQTLNAPPYNLPDSSGKGEPPPTSKDKSGV